MRARARNSSWDGEEGQLYVDDKLQWRNAFTGGSLCNGAPAGVPVFVVLSDHTAISAELKINSTLVSLDESYGITNVSVSVLTNLGGPGQAPWQAGLLDFSQPVCVALLKKTKTKKKKTGSFPN